MRCYFTFFRLYHFFPPFRCCPWCSNACNLFILGCPDMLWHGPVMWAIFLWADMMYLSASYIPLPLSKRNNTKSIDCTDSILPISIVVYNLDLLTACSMSSVSRLSVRIVLVYSKPCPRCLTINVCVAFMPCILIFIFLASSYTCKSTIGLSGQKNAKNSTGGRICVKPRFTPENVFAVNHG